jgi:transcriptional regulator with XRE-family HTH domain
MQTEKFSQRLARIRKSRKMSVTELTSRVGISVSTYRAWEYGRAVQGPDAFVKLSRALEVSLEELMAGTQPKMALALEKIERSERLLAEARLALLSHA